MIGAALLHLVLAFSASTGRGAPQGTKYEFQGFEYREKTSCVNDPVSQVTYRWVRLRRNSTAERTALRDSVASLVPGAAGVSRYTVSVQRPVVIGLVKKRIKCVTSSGTDQVVDSYQFFSARTRDELLRNVEARLRPFERVIGFEVVEWIEEPSSAGLDERFTKRGAAGIRG